MFGLPWNKTEDTIAVTFQEAVANQWKRFERSLPDQVQVSCSLTGFKEATEVIDLHTFGDTSGARTSAAMYAVVYQASGVNQGLLAAKSRLAKKGLTIARLELVSAHMAVNLMENVKNALEGQLVRSVHGWLHCTVALHRFRREGSAYKQFVANRVNKIRDKAHIQWRPVGTDQNPAAKQTSCTSYGLKGQNG